MYLLIDLFASRKLVQVDTSVDCFKDSMSTESDQATEAEVPPHIYTQGPNTLRCFVTLSSRRMQPRTIATQLLCAVQLLGLEAMLVCDCILPMLCGVVF